MRRLVALVLAGLLAGIAGSAGAAPAGATSTDQPIDRVLVVSLPTLAWSDLEDVELPAIEGLLDRSAVADLSTRVVSRITTAGDAYATIGAGTRARTRRTVEGLSFSAGELYAGLPAEDAYEQRVGRPPDAEVFSLGQTSTVERNRSLRYDAEVGALGQVLRRRGIGRAVVANADIDRVETASSLGRDAAVTLMGPQGTLPGGRVASDLLVDDPVAPFGRRFDTDAVLRAFDLVWEEGDRSAVVVEASDLVRTDAFRSLATARQRTTQRRRALDAADQLVAGLLERVDPERDAVLVLGPYHATGRVHLTVAGLRAPGIAPGLLQSATTRRAGFVTLVDVAPTVLDLFGLDRPESMEGRPFERTEEGGSAGARRSWLAEEDAAANLPERMVSPASVLFVVFNLLLWPLVVLEAVRSRRVFRQVLEAAALGLLGFLPFTYLAGLLPFHRWGGGAYWAFVLLGGLALGVAALAIGRRREIDPLLVVLGAVLGLLVVDILLGAPLQLNTVFGYSPTVAGRFAGMGNLAFAQLAGAALLLAGVVATRLRGRFGVVIGIGLLAVALVVDGAPMWGSDVGGVLTMVPAGGLTAALLLGWRIRPRAVVLGVLGAVGVVLLFGLADLSRAPEDRAHLGRLLERVADGGWGALETVILRKLDANLSVLTSSVWTLMVPLCLGVVGWLLWRRPGGMARLQDEPALRATLPGIGVAAVLGFALNDSGIAVPGMLLGVVGASLAYLLVRTSR